MSARPESSPRGDRPASSSVARRVRGEVWILPALAVVLVAGLWWTRSAEGPTASSPRSPDLAPPTAPPASATPATAPPSPFSALVGRWRRPDGGYVLEIRSVQRDGNLEAAYFNPDPIPVQRALVREHGGAVQVVVVLGAHYAGSTYALVYDAESDRLAGVYDQRVARQQFEVAFERAP
jgi:hypothetical protein